MTVTAIGPYTVSGYDGYTFYKFTGAGSTTWSVPSDCSSVDVTVVGGGGAPNRKSGSGSGYMVSRFNQSVFGEVTIIVDGGATASLDAPVNGGSSSFGSISADGGHGNGDGGYGGNGGSGGGGGLGDYAGGSNGSDGAGGTSPGKGQGTGSTELNPAPCSGTTGIDGVLRCGGGGSTNGGTGLGGAGGGGNGAKPAGTSGTNDYGGGGGGRYNSKYLGGNGGSGIVIVRYIPRSKKRGQPQINSGGLLIV